MFSQATATTANKIIKLPKKTMRTYEEARIEYLEYFPHHYDLDGNGGTTFCGVLETEFGWYFALDTIPALVSEFPWVDSDVGYLLITKKIGDTTKYPGVMDKNPPEYIDIDVIPLWDRAAIWKRRYLAIKHRLFSQVYLLGNRIIYPYLGGFIQATKVSDILFIGSLVNWEESLNIMDWHLVIVEKTGRVLFIPVNSLGFIKFWSKLKYLLGEQGIFLPLFPSNKTETVIAFPSVDRYKPIFKKVTLKFENFWDRFCIRLGYYHFEYELSDEIKQQINKAFKE